MDGQEETEDLTAATPPKEESKRISSKLRKSKMPNRGFSPTKLRPPETSETATNPMQRMAQGKFEFLKNVRPSKIDLALDYVKLDPADITKEPKDKLENRQKSRKKGKRFRSVSSQTKNEKFFLHHVCKRHQYEASKAEERLVRESSAWIFGWMPSSFRATFFLPAWTDENFAAAIYRYNWSEFVKGKLLKLQQILRWIPRVNIRFPSAFASFLFILLSAICIHISVSFFTDSGFWVKILIRLIVIASLKAIESGVSRGRFRCPSRCTALMPLALHKKILKRQQRVIVHKTLEFLAANKFHISMEEEFPVSDAGEKDHETSTATPALAVDHVETDHDLLKNECNECLKYLKYR